MNWYYDKTKIVSIIAAIIIVIGGIVGGGFWMDSNAGNELDAAVTSITSTTDELWEAIDGLPTQQDLTDLDSSVGELQADVEGLVESQEELDAAQQLVLDSILDRLDDVEDDLTHTWEDLYGEDGMLELLYDLQRDIDYLWNYIATH